MLRPLRNQLVGAWQIYAEGVQQRQPGANEHDGERGALALWELRMTSVHHADSSRRIAVSHFPSGSRRTLATRVPPRVREGVRVFGRAIRPPAGGGPTRP